MGAAENRAKSAAQAAYMKERGIRRTTARCPMGCGSLYSTERKNGLMEHLNGCRGSQKQVR